VGKSVGTISPRLMIISSIGTPLPAALVSGIGDTSGPNAFANIWNTAEGGIPAGWTFGNHPEDLKIARIDLTDLFIPVALWNNDLIRTPVYGLDALAPGASV